MHLGHSDVRAPQMSMLEPTSDRTNHEMEILPSERDRYHEEINPKLRWLEDVFPILKWSLCRGYVSFQGGRWWQLNYFFIFTPNPGEMTQFDELMFFKGVGSTTN